MAKSTVPRHSKTSRKPVTIELDPRDVQSLPPKNPAQNAGSQTSNTVPQAEPVGDFTKPQQQSAPSTSGTAGAAADQPASAAGVSRAGNSQSENIMNSARAKPSAAPQSSSPWLAGIAGGIIALAGAGALQWFGLIGAADQQQPDQLQVQSLQQQVTQLEQQLGALQNAPAPAADPQLLRRLEAAEANAAKAQQLISALPPMAAPAEGDQEALRQELNQRLGALEERLSATSTAASNAATKANAAMAGDAQALTLVQQQIAALQTKFDQQLRQPDMAMIIAVNALKQAIDRGGSFNNELQTYAGLTGEEEVAPWLKALAPTGIATMSQLNTQFSTLADAMVAVENQPQPDAGIWQQLMSSAKGLVRARPVGDVAGTDAGAVTARIEVALQAGDAERALAQWAQLPASAKQAGQDFYHHLVARRDADALVSALIAKAAQQQGAADKAPVPSFGQAPE